MDVPGGCFLNVIMTDCTNFQLEFLGLAFAGSTKMSPWALRTWNFTYLLTKQL